MHAHGGEHVWIRRPHYHCHGAAGGQASNVDPFLVQAVGQQQFAYQPGDDRGFPLVATLVARLEPVPALRNVVALRLLGIRDEAPSLLGQDVHACTGREIIGRLRAPVQHHDQRQWLSAIGARNEELVATRTRRTGVRMLAELGPDTEHQVFDQANFRILHLVSATAFRRPLETCLRWGPYTDAAARGDSGSATPPSRC